MDFHNGGLQGVVPALPCLPEDALLALMPLPWDGAEVLPIEVGMATGAEPPATYKGNEGTILTHKNSRQKILGSMQLMPLFPPFF